MTDPWKLIEWAATELNLGGSPGAVAMTLTKALEAHAKEATARDRYPRTRKKRKDSSNE